MEHATYDRFKELRQKYYLAGRSLMVNQLFGMAAINFGYSIELSLKFLLLLKNDLMDPRKHHIDKYYRHVVEKEYIPPLNVSNDFIQFMNERLNARYPSHIAGHLASHEAGARAYVFTIDFLHCYDDFILQLDDAVTSVANDPRASIGFRCCRDIEAAGGRIFFHCNDHAIARIPLYRTLLREARDEGDNYDACESILSNPESLWNFQGMMAYRPWGPKPDWSPVSTFQYHKPKGVALSIQAAKWTPNNTGIGMYISSAEVTLPKGSYQVKFSEVTIPGT